MAYGKNKGRFREIRVGRFDPNMGAAEAPVKSTDVDGVPGGYDLVSKKLRNTILELRSLKVYLLILREFGYKFLTKTGRRRAPTDEPPGDGGLDETTDYIAETVADLVRLARRHKFDLLGRLLEMAQMEAEERVRLRGKHNLS